MKEMILVAGMLLGAIAMGDLGGSASGGDINVKVPAFHYTCVASFFDRSLQVSTTHHFDFDNKNYKQSQGDENFQLMMLPSWSDFDGAYINKVHLWVYKERDNTPLEMSRTSSSFLLAQKRIEIAIWNDRNDADINKKSHRRAATVICDLK